ncbi:hypothetical protein WA1_01350 [Scytonema hofmannii PCC 7110]|uniref:Uncharacterized protein n=1 Tax=Scytonema hofmannii PCC 7110 TaxID=128403 RepID=A0A139XGT4_9CYAN|nr:hypothetical protein WA1_01350 [Scytonema hofmannii PCC 7110]
MRANLAGKTWIHTLIAQGDLSLLPILSLFVGFHSKKLSIDNTKTGGRRYNKLSYLCRLDI